MIEFLRDYKKFTAKAWLDNILNLREIRREWMLYLFEFTSKFDSVIKKIRFKRECIL